MRMTRIIQIVSVLSLATLLFTCDKPEDVQYAKVDLEMSAAGVNAATLGRLLGNDSEFFTTVLSDSGMDEGDFISFTPEEVLMHVHYISLATGWAFYDEGHPGGDAPPGWLVLPIDTTIDLVSVGELNTLFDYTYSIPDTFFNEYVAMAIHVDHDLRISGIVHAKNSTYTLDKTVFTFNGIEEYVFDDTVAVDINNFPTIRIIFDAEKTAYLMKLDDRPPDTDGPPEDPHVAVIMENALIMAFEGDEEVSIERYAVYPENSPPNSESYVQVVFGVTAPDVPRLFNWVSVFNGKDGDVLQPAGLRAPLIIDNGDGTYTLKEDRVRCPLPEGTIPYSELEFPAFQRVNHSGTLIFEGEEFSYIAVKM